MIYVSIPEEVFNTVKYIIGEPAKEYKWKDGNVYGLYAWTDKEKLFTEFMRIRYQDIYTIVEKEVEHDEFKVLKTKYKYLRIGMYELLINDNESLEIACTRNEYDTSTEDGRECFWWEFGPPISEFAHYNIFNNTVRDALDKLGYVNAYVMKYGDEGEQAVVDNNLSYGVTYFSNKNIITFNNEVGSFVLLNRFFLIGKLW